MQGSRQKDNKSNSTLAKYYRDFKIFYKNKYGKVGFIILLSFVIIALMTPAIVYHPNYFYEAPEVDTHIASQLANTSLQNVTQANGGASIYGPFSTDVLNEGASAIYFGTSSGKIYYYGLGTYGTDAPLGSYGVVYNSSFGNSVRMLSPTVVPLINCVLESEAISSNTLIERFVVMPFTNGQIEIGKLVFLDLGLKKPEYIPFVNFSYNGTIVGNVITNSLPFSGTTDTSIPSFNYENNGYNTPGTVFFITQNKTGDYLHSYGISPFKLFNVTKITMNNPAGIEYYGAGFSPNKAETQARILIYNSTSIQGYFLNQTLAWSTNNSLNVDLSVGLQIPSYYQVSYSKINSAFFISNGDTVSNISLSSGLVRTVIDLSQKLYSLSTTPGAAGFPTHILAAASTQAFVISLNSSNAVKVNSVPLPVGSGNFTTAATYDPVSDALILVSQDGEILSFSLDAPSGEPFSWSYHVSPTPSNTSQVLYFSDANTGFGEISMISNLNYIYIFNSTAKSMTPIPSMAKTPSGARFLLGTTTSGQDVWAEFIESFWTDWVFGLSIGLVTILVSVAVALYVGYRGGALGSALETASLALFLIPGLALLIALASLFPKNADFEDLILIVSLTGWPFAAFSLIGIVRSISARSFVEASKLFGSKTFHIMRGHILPNIGPLLLYLLALSIAGGIGAVSGLEFLGLAPLSVATWGGMLNEVYNDYFAVAASPQWIFPPAIALTLFVVAIIFISRGMDEVVNPRLRRR